MAEDAVFKNSSIAGLSTDDITPNIYEGGFKTWECSIDLANYLVNHQNTASERYREGLHVIEASRYLGFILCIGVEFGVCADILQSLAWCWYRITNPNPAENVFTSKTTYIQDSPFSHDTHRL